MNEPKFPTYIMKTLREREGLEPSDPTLDSTIEEYSQRRAAKEVTAWNLGSPGWFDTFNEWIESVGGKIVFGDEEAN